MKKNILGLFIIGAVLLGTTATFAINNIMRNDDIGEITNYGLKNSRTIKTNIDLEQAKKIALDDAKTGQITSAELDRENGIWIFEIEVLDGNVEKDYKINADTGKIIRVEVEKDRDLFVNAQITAPTQSEATKPAQSGKVNSQSPAKADMKASITVEKAKEIALKDAKSGSVTQWELDRDYGVLVYEIEVVDGNKEIDYKIDASTGKIIKTEVEVNGVKTKVATQGNTAAQANAAKGSKNTNAANNTNKPNHTVVTSSNNTLNNPSNTKITLDKAKEIAMKQAKNGEITKIELDRENGVLVYEVEIRENRVEKEYKINAQTGEVIGFDRDYDNHDDHDDHGDHDDHDDYDDDDDDDRD